MRPALRQPRAIGPHKHRSKYVNTHEARCGGNCYPSPLFLFPHPPSRSATPPHPSQLTRALPQAHQHTAQSADPLHITHTMSTQTRIPTAAVSTTGLRHLANVEYSDLFTILATGDRARFPEARTSYSLKPISDVAPPLAPSSPRPAKLTGRGSKGSYRSDDESTLVDDELDHLLKLKQEVSTIIMYCGARGTDKNLKQTVVPAEIKPIGVQQYQALRVEPTPAPQSPIALQRLRESVHKSKRTSLESDSAPSVLSTERDETLSHYMAKIREHYTFESFQDTIRDIIEESQSKYRPLAEGSPAPMPSAFAIAMVDVDEDISADGSAATVSVPSQLNGQESAAPKRRRVSNLEPNSNTKAERFNRMQLLMDLVACALPHKLSPRWKKAKTNLGKPKSWLRAASSRKRELAEVD